MSYSVVILRTPPYWSVRVALCNFKLGGQFISLPITHSKRYDAQTWYYFRRRVKRFPHGIIWPEWLPKSKTVLASGSSPEKEVPTLPKLTGVFATSVYKQPTTYCIKTTTVSSGDIHAHPRAVIPPFGSNCGHVTRK